MKYLLNLLLSVKEIFIVMFTQDIVLFITVYSMGVDKSVLWGSIFLVSLEVIYIVLKLVSIKKKGNYINLSIFKLSYFPYILIGIGINIIYNMIIFKLGMEFDVTVNFVEKTDDNEKMVKDLEKVGKKLVKGLWKIAAKTFTFEKEGTKERINGEKTSVRLITITIDDKNLAEFIEAAYEYISETDLIIDFLEEYEDSFTSYMEMLNGDADSIVDIYEDAIDELGDSIDDICDSLDDSFEPVTIMLSTAKLSAKLLKLEVKYDRETLFTLELGEKGVAKSDKISLSFDDYKVTYAIEEDSKDAFKAAFTISEKWSSYEYKKTVSLDINKKSGKYQASFEDYYSNSDYYNYQYGNYGKYKRTDTYTVKGKYSEDGGAVTFTVNSFVNSYNENSDFNSSSWEDSFDISASITFNPKDKMPKPDTDYNSIADIDETNIEEWINKAEDLDW